MSRAIGALPAVCLVLAAACDGTLRDGAGWGACELPARACQGGQICVRGRCAASAPEAAGGWRQRTDGFETVSLLPGSAVALDHANGDALTATYDAGQSPALATAGFRASFPGRTAGRIQGTVRLQASEPFDGEVWFLVVKARSGAVLVAVSLSAEGVGLYSAEGALQAAPVINGLDLPSFPTVASLFVSGWDNEVALEWSQGAYLRMELNGGMLFERTLDPLGPSEAAQVAEISLGLNEYQGTMGRLGIVLRDWELRLPEP